MKKHIPNTITSLNLLCGSIGAVFALDGRYDMALLLMVTAAVFDFLDGMAARLLHAYSDMGKELDLLADVVSFGFLPGCLAYSLLATAVPTNDWLPFSGFLLTVFSALRLAKFNIDERQTTSFMGLATPANALFWGGAAFSYSHIIVQYPVAVVIVVVLMSCLLVVEVPFFSLKFKHLHWHGNEVRFLFLGGCAILAGVFRTDALMWIILWYILFALVTDGISVLRNCRKDGSQPSE